MEDIITHTVKFELHVRTVQYIPLQWLRVSSNPEYILVNVKTGEPMSSLNITQNLTRIFKTHFNKSVGTTLLRHIVLTEKFGKQLQEMEKADVMGHDVSTAQSVYITCCARTTISASMPARPTAQLCALPMTHAAPTTRTTPGCEANGW